MEWLFQRKAPSGVPQAGEVAGERTRRRSGQCMLAGSDGGACPFATLAAAESQRGTPQVGERHFGLSSEVPALIQGPHMGRALYSLQRTLQFMKHFTVDEA